MFKLFIKDIKAATAIEYALIAVGISISIYLVVYTLGDNVAALFEQLIGLFS